MKASDGVKTERLDGQATMPGKAVEVITSAELAKRWGLPESWVRDQVRSRAQDPIPHLRFGKYIRFEYGSEPLEQWLARHRNSTKQSSNGDGYKGGLN